MVDGQDVELTVDTRPGLAAKLEFELPDGSDDVSRLELIITGPQGFRFANQRTMR